MSKSKDLLLRANLRCTPVREQVLESFLQARHVLSFHDLQARLPKRLDKVTVYRTLHAFVSKGLLHEIPDSKGLQKFGLCSDHCPQHIHVEDHIHFTCHSCGQTYCLDVHVQLPPLPTGFKSQGATVVVAGECRFCQIDTAVKTTV